MQARNNLGLSSRPGAALTARGRTAGVIAGALAALGLLLILCLRSNVFPIEEWTTGLALFYAALLLMVPLPLVALPRDHRGGPTAVRVVADASLFVVIRGRRVELRKKDAPHGRQR